jgi:predicted site-specific integrase-resolvase
MTATEKLGEHILAECPAALACELLGVSYSTLNNWRRSGKVKGVQGLNKRWRFDLRPLLAKKGS